MNGALLLTHFGWGQILSLLAQVVLPLIVGFVTKRSMPSGTKALLLLLLTIITQSVTTFAERVSAGAPFDWRALLANIIIGFIVSVAVHYGLWKPTGASDSAQDAGPVTDQKVPPPR